MIIQNSKLQMQVEHEQYEKVTVVQSSQHQNFHTLFVDASGAGEQIEPPQSSVLLMTDEGFVFNTGQGADVDQIKESSIQCRLFQALLEAITGRKSALAQTDLDLSTSEIATDSDYGAGRVQRSAATNFLDQTVTMEVAVSVTQRVEYFESTEYLASGEINTADGRTFNLNLCMKMEQAYQKTQSASLTQTVQFKDPLVVNFGGTAAELEETTFNFDIDADGRSECFNTLAGHSGWLALDKNQDGKINDGSELFGAISGNGFEDLSKFDEDNNGFIDESDTVYDQLLIWQQLPESDRFSSLKDKQIGAIYLGAANTPFNLKNSQQETRGEVVSSSVYLTETGGAGTIQQVNMAVLES